MANAPQTKPAAKPIPQGVTVAVDAGPAGGYPSLKDAKIYPEDLVNSPKHYTQGKRLELIDLIIDLPAWQANAIKYIYRMGQKSGVAAEQDLAKARKYLEYGERLMKGEPISDTLRDQIHDWDNPGIGEIGAGIVKEGKS